LFQQCLPPKLSSFCKNSYLAYSFLVGLFTILFRKKFVKKLNNPVIVPVKA